MDAPVTPEERQALREKHRQQSCCHDCDPHCVFRCVECDFPYPCDVIKVLDWADRVINAAEVYGVYAQMMADL